MTALVSSKMNAKLLGRSNLPSLKCSQSCDSHISTHCSLRDSAALLLSISDIAKSEIDTSGLSSLWDDDVSCSPIREHPLLLPSFPFLGSDSEPKSTPGLLKLSRSSSSHPSRARSVSMDVQDWNEENEEGKNSSPRTSQRKQSLRLSTKARKEYFSDSSDPSNPPPKRSRHRSISLDLNLKKGKMLQGSPPTGVAIQMIKRKKFSWKNYPEVRFSGAHSDRHQSSSDNISSSSQLEQFLVVNRDEYLKHSALNYTIQQKQYNNRLTENLLELATTHGYIFDTSDFGFVTVRDRIRCYFKSYVQSAKKRGILMGYAARKAGLLDAQELQDQAKD